MSMKKVQYVGHLATPRVVVSGRREWLTDKEGKVELPAAVAKEICKQADWKAVTKEITSGE